MSGVATHPLVSIIIPTKNSGRTLGACLASCKKQTYAHLEIIVVDNFSQDYTKKIAQSYTDLFFEHGPERSAQRNYGVHKALGEYVCIIDSDMQLSPEVIEQCVEQFTKKSSLYGVVIPEASFGEGFWAQCKKLERSYYVGVDRMEAARCFRKDIFLEVGGYDEKNIGTEDYDLPQRIQAQYGKQTIGRIDAYIYHNEGTFSLWRSCQKKFYYGQRLSAYTKQPANKENFSKQASITKRYSLFFSDRKKISEQPSYWIGMLWMKTTELFCLGFGYLFGKLKIIENIYR